MELSDDEQHPVLSSPQQWAGAENRMVCCVVLSDEHISFQSNISTSKHNRFHVHFNPYCFQPSVCYSGKVWFWCFSFAPELVGYSVPRDLHLRAAYLICESRFFYSSGC